MFAKAPTVRDRKKPRGPWDVPGTMWRIWVDGRDTNDAHTRAGNEEGAGEEGRRAEGHCGQEDRAGQEGCVGQEDSAGHARAHEKGRTGEEDDRPQSPG